MSIKILIFGDNESVEKDTSSSLTSKGFETEIIFYPSGSSVDFSDLKLDENNDFDYVIMGHLDGNWKHVAPMIEPYGVTPIVYSANEYVVKAAKEMGFHAFDRPKGLEEMVELIKSGQE